MSTIHVVYSGRNETLEFSLVFRSDWLATLGFTEIPESKSLSQVQIKQALANFYDVSANEFADHYIETNPNGNITVRPNAEWGKA